MSRQKIIVIGGVAAGPAAAAEAKRTAPDADVLLVEQGPRISYGACEMPWLLSGVVGRAEELVVLSPADMERTRGVVVRTLAAGLTKKKLKADVGYLVKVWNDCQERVEQNKRSRKKRKAPYLVHEEPDVVLRAARGFQPRQALRLLPPTPFLLFGNSLFSRLILPSLFQLLFL